MTDNRNLEKECLDWYNQNNKLYTACGNSIHKLLTVLLEQAGIPVHSIQYRVKEKDSFLTKCKESRYTSPLDEITDVCGLRIITYTNKDVDDICKLIEDQFAIDPKHSINKADQLKDNEVGYLSVHYIAKLDSRRTKLEEYKPYSNIRFEIQIRTLLQHAWAEIEHDRNYKFSGELPKDIKRRFHLVAGTLELMDREFDSLAREIEQYATEVQNEAKAGNLEFDIDSTSLIEYLKVKLKDYPHLESTFNGRDKIIVQELNDCELFTLDKLDLLMDDDSIRRICELSISKDSVNYLGFLRDLLMIKMPEKYFTKAWQNHWSAMDPDEYDKLISLNPAIKKYRTCFNLMI